MPYKRGYRKKTFRRRPYRGRRKFGPKRRRGATKVMINRGPSVIPDEFITTLRYDEEFQFGAASGALGHYFFRGNSLYDPNETGVGVSPAGFNQMKALYTRYRVNACACRLQILPVEDAAIHSLQFVLLAAAEPPIVGLSDPITKYSAMPYAKFGMTGLYNMRPVVLKHYMTTKKMFSKKAANASEDYAADTSANPAFQWTWLIIGSDFNQTESWTARVMVRLKFYCTFYQRTSLTEV